MLNSCILKTRESIEFTGISPVFVEQLLPMKNELEVAYFELVLCERLVLLQC